MKLVNRPNRYWVVADNGDQELILADDGCFHANPARPMYFKGVRSAARWKNDNDHVMAHESFDESLGYPVLVKNHTELSEEYKIFIQGPRGGRYEVSYHGRCDVRRVSGGLVVSQDTTTK